MDQREAIRRLLDALPLPMRERIEREASKYRAKKPLNIEALYNEVLAELKANSKNAADLETKRLELLKCLNEENPEDGRER